MSTYTKKRLIIYQAGQMIFEEDVYVCLEGKNTYNTDYYCSSNRDLRYIKFSYTPSGSELCTVSLGVGDTFILNAPGVSKGFFGICDEDENEDEFLQKL